MLSTLGNIIWRISIVISVVLTMVILGSAAAEGRLFQPETLLAVVIWGGGVLLVGGFLSSFLK